MFMEDLLQLLKEKLVLAAKLAEAAEKQRRALKENLNGRDVTAATREVEGLLARLDACGDVSHANRGADPGRGGQPRGLFAAKNAGEAISGSS